MIKNIPPCEIWFITGSQHLYGPETLKQVADHSQKIAEGLSRSKSIPLKVIYKPILTGPEEIRKICQEANNSPECAGLIAWMHTFSPAKMWIGGLSILQKPLLHLHTQFNRDLPWTTIDMDFMNLNQAAHGDREFGYINSRLRRARKVVAGYWEEKEVQERIAVWMRAARAWLDWQGAKFARFGDNMRQVAVTEGNKVSAEIQFGFSVNGYGIGDLVEQVRQVTEKELTDLLEIYKRSYKLAPSLVKGGEKHDSLREGARIELGLRSFLKQGGFKGFTTTFEDLHGLRQLPGLAVQRLMAEGYGFAGEGDWKTAALLRAMKVMADGLPGGTSFMEDYTYHLHPSGSKVLGSHMLEICESIASRKPSLEVHPLGIGGKEDPVRLVFDVNSGDAINVSLVDLGNRFRLLLNEVWVEKAPKPLPKLPVARAVWVPKPDFRVGCEAWILAGGAHHTGFSQSLTREYFEDFSEISGVELLTIGKETTIPDFKKEIRWNEIAYHLSPQLGVVR